MVIIEIFSGFGQALAPNVYVFLISRFVLGIAAYGRFLTGNLLSRFNKPGLLIFKEITHN